MRAKGSGRPPESGGWGRGCEPARHRLGQEEWRRGGEAARCPRGARRCDPAARPHPALGSLPGRGPCARSACADSLRRNSRGLTPADLRNPATLREKCFPPCNTPRKRKMSGDDGGGRVTYPCSSRGCGDSRARRRSPVQAARRYVLPLPLSLPQLG